MTAEERKTRMSLYLSQSAREKLEYLAKRAGRSMNDTLIRLIEQAYDKTEIVEGQRGDPIEALKRQMSAEMPNDSSEERWRAFSDGTIRGEMYARMAALELERREQIEQVLQRLSNDNT